MSRSLATAEGKQLLCLLLQLLVSFETFSSVLVETVKK